MRYSAYILTIVLALLCLILGLTVESDFLWALLVLIPLALLGTWDLIQTRHSITRNYPIIAHMRFLLEMIRPEIHQYFIESNIDGRPFNHDARSLIYERAKNIDGLKPFGTELDVYGEEYEWLNHSMAPRPKSKELFRTTVGGPECKQPYSCSILNISAMSFGALSPNALLALNAGAQKGNFYHCTGEGGVSPYHLKNGGDLVWQIGTGYFGCRNNDGTFNPDLFQEQAAHESVKMIEIKISQGAKPGHGGVLPAAKITPEIASTRKILMGQDCISPPGHNTFNTPIGLCEYIAQLRELSGGKPIGFKLCIGHPSEFLSVCKAMLQTGILPDFITVDGGEGGTGAAPLEFSDNMGMPLKTGLIFVHNALVGCNLRDKIKIAAAGKISSAFTLSRALAIGADWCNSARGFMMAVGCIQAQSCHTNECPVGVATQDPGRQRALNVGDKSERTFNFHHNTMEALAEVIAAAGLDHPDELRPWHIYLRTKRTEVLSYHEAFDFLQPGELLNDCPYPVYKKVWDLASADTFETHHG
ncbi:FMN-binding glutamate synthase family protein [Gimesia maris]|uniref:Ferredoxin-dependent glutamate synthase 1 n=1 Tax=Gimesia maris TaxID=122 RepID=A0ABX5YJ31_9PLAN|nr:FMN-binding glutamate synthase family protein [Gimesia maris]EDL59930.1 ferredoxin-dependent glutamate synthase [Gimesia maris DSM 8797]QEG15672.1 Ferredoxin-dependent glutamate synthase 1 [Gimesia maris]QGQ31043.1 FMN-binding glutamate synthase family protein [Gimesia maris]